MPSYSIEIPNIAETELTGYLGTAVATYRGHEWRVPLGRSGTTRDGYPAGNDMVPPAVWAYATRMYDMLAAEYVAGRERRKADAANAADTLTA